MVAADLNTICLFAQQAAEPEKLPPTTRTIVYMALLGILLLGMLLIVIVLLGGHWVRRLGSYRRGPAVPADVVTHIPTAESSQTPDSDSRDEDPSCTDTISPDDTIIT